jgi:hypothetical protein
MRSIVFLGIILKNINDLGLAESYGDPTFAGGANRLFYLTSNL